MNPQLWGFRSKEGNEIHLDCCHKVQYDDFVVNNDMGLFHLLKCLSESTLIINYFVLKN